jgi:hypothetical protein
MIILCIGIEDEVQISFSILNFRKMFMGIYLDIVGF